jgi:hypothetical protein
MRQRQRHGARALCELWLASAAAFRRLRNFEEAQKALESAEEADAGNPDLWCQVRLKWPWLPVPFDFDSCRLTPLP